jgi:hypothetical protein
MCKHLLHSCKIDPEALPVGKAQVLELGIAGRKLSYGRGLRARIELPTEQLDVELRGLTVEVVAALSLPKDANGQSSFVTVGSDQTLVTWSLDGQELARMDKHQTQVLGLWVFSDGCIASCSVEPSWFLWEAVTLFVWDARHGRKLKRIAARAGFVEPTYTPARARAVEQVVLVGSQPSDASEASVCLPARWWSKRIVGLETGKQLAQLRWQSEPLTAVRKLESGAYVTVAESGMILRSSGGRLLTLLPKFSLDDGYHEFPKQSPIARHVQIIDDLHGLHLIAASGVRRGSRAADEPMAKDLKAYLKSHAQARKELEAPDAQLAELKLAQLGFRSHPLCDSAAVGGELKALPKHESLERKQLWEFFHRPRNARIQSWLLAEVKAARDARARVSRAHHEHGQRALLARKRIGSVRRALIVAVAVLIVSRVVVERWPALFILGEAWLHALACLVTAAGIFALWWLHGEESAMISAQTALSGLPQHMAGLLGDIAAERARLRAALPEVVTPGLYTGDNVRSTIDACLDKLRQLAIQKCKDEAGELIESDKSTFVLRDWSLLARVDPERTTPHLESFWWTNDRFLLAVERVQVVLATRHRLYVYRVDYDFVSQTSYNEERHVIYYDEVADVIIRDKHRPVVLSGVSGMVCTKELVIVSKGGAVISLNALHKRSFEGLYAASQATISARLADLERNLKTESSHSTPGHAERITAELGTLLAESLSAAPEDRSRIGVGQALTRIKRLILGKTDPSHRRGSAWPKLERTEADLN